MECYIGESTVIQAQVENATAGFWLADERVIAEVNGRECLVKLDVTKTTKTSGILVISGPGGEIQRSIALNVQIPQKSPFFTERLHETTAEEGDEILLTCAFDGVPTPEIQWCFNDEILETSGDTLKISNCKLSNSGKYSAKISSEAGTDKSTAIVEINKKSLPPKILNSPPDGEYEQGASVDLQCFVGGHPDPKSKGMS